MNFVNKFKPLLLGAFLLIFCVSSWQREASAADVIETIYRAVGKYEVTTLRVEVHGEGYQLFYPKDLGIDGVRQPILTWGNGTGGSPDDAEALLTHLASWGYVVIASENPMTGLGTEMHRGAQYLIEQDDDVHSPFYRALDTEHIGVFGMSQGAGGTLNAGLMGDGMYKSAITVALPKAFWWITPLPDLSLWPSTTPLFFIRGGYDWPITSRRGASDWFNPVPGAAMMATQRRASHLEVLQEDTRLKGYITAWFEYTLRSDQWARRAFSGPNPEILRNPAWFEISSKSLL